MTQVAREKSPSVETNDYEPVLFTRRGKIAAAVLAVVGITGLGVGIHEAYKSPSFSPDTHTYSVGEGEGVENAARTVEGVEDIDMRHATDYIYDLPENADVLDDGLQFGETLVVPNSAED